MTPICPCVVAADIDGIDDGIEDGIIIPPERDGVGVGIRLVVGIAVGVMPPEPRTTTTNCTVTFTVPHRAVTIAFPGLAYREIFALPDQFMGLVEAIAAEPPLPVMA